MREGEAAKDAEAAEKMATGGRRASPGEWIERKRRTQTPHAFTGACVRRDVAFLGELGFLRDQGPLHATPFKVNPVGRPGVPEPMNPNVTLPPLAPIVPFQKPAGLLTVTTLPF
jgi:hypothetical protein